MLIFISHGTVDRGRWLKPSGKNQTASSSNRQSFDVNICLLICGNANRQPKDKRKAIRMSSF
jgi:hypothetical protein